jgi:molecular chaperone GrpE
VIRLSWQNEALIDKLREWLAQTSDELASLDADQPLAAGAVPSADAESGVQPTALELPTVGLLQLVEAFTALRHELKLQTKGTRQLEEVVGRSLEGLQTATQSLQSVQAREREAADRAALPLIELLVGLDESMLRAGRAFEAAQQRGSQSPIACLAKTLENQYAARSPWQRWWAGRWHRHVQHVLATLDANPAATESARLREGLQLIQSRLARGLQEQGIRRIDETGVRVDPTKMTVVELVDDSDAPPETVLDVVRPGYLWRERVIRYAEVRAAARPAGSPFPADGQQYGQDDR